MALAASGHTLRDGEAESGMSRDRCGQNGQKRSRRSSVKGTHTDVSKQGRGEICRFAGRGASQQRLRVAGCWRRAGAGRRGGGRGGGAGPRRRRRASGTLVPPRFEVDTSNLDSFGCSVTVRLRARVLCGLAAAHDMWGVFPATRSYIQHNNLRGAAGVYLAARSPSI